MRKLILSVLLFLIISILLTCLPLLNQAATPDLSISGGMVLNPTLYPGESFSHTIKITAGKIMDLNLELVGLRHNVDGAVEPLPPAQDTGPYTARPFINFVNQVLQLQPGVEQRVELSINIPPGTPPGERYASIYMYNTPNAQGIGTKIATNVIIIVNTPGYTPVNTGKINSLSVPVAEKGQPIRIHTNFENTGNCRLFNAKNSVVLRDSSGTTIWQSIKNAVATPSLFPNQPRNIISTYSPGLETGIYSVTSSVHLEDGTVFDTKTITFQVKITIPDKPNLLSPGSINAFGPEIDTLTPTFHWEPVANATSYSLTVSKYPYESTNTVYTGTVTGSSFILGPGILEYGGKYAWQMKSNNAAGWSDNSSLLYFQTLSATPTATPTPSPTLTSTPKTTQTASPSPSAVVTTTPRASPVTTTTVLVNTPRTRSTRNLPNQKPISDYLLPGMDENSLTVFDFSGETTSVFSAVQQAGVEVSFTGNKGNGVLAVGAFSSEPRLSVPFSAPIIKGGTGKTPIKYVAVFVEGARQGKTTIKVHLSREEIDQFQPESLIMAYYTGNKWIRCENIYLSLDERVISGEIPTVRLNGTVIGIGGGTDVDSGGSLMPTLVNRGGSVAQIPWSLAGIVIASILITGFLIIITRYRRKASKVSN